MRTLDGVGAAAMVLGLSVAACSSSGKVLETNAASSPGDSGSGGSASGSGGNEPGSGGAPDGSGGNGAGGLLNVGGARDSDAGSCEEIRTLPEYIANDLLILLDQSVSMTNTFPGGASSWWSVTTSAISAFVDNPGMIAGAVGLQYFPLNGTAPASCSAPYGTPEIPVGILPANAGALKTSLAAHSPNGVTPTGPALTGAIEYMKARVGTNQATGSNQVVVLVTDGFPTECQPQQIADVAAIAADGKANGVTTAVVGLNLGSGGGNLDPIAAAGGTRKAILVDQGDLGAQIQRGLLRALFSQDCSTYAIKLPDPPSGTIGAITVDVGRFTGLTETLGRVPDAASCTAASGFYVDGAAPPVVHLCGAACDEPISSVNVAYSCR